MATSAQRSAALPAPRRLAGELRTWVPNRLPRAGMGASTDTYFGAVTPIEDDDEWETDQIAEEARAAGLPPPPTGRIWLLRSPWPRIPVTVIYEIIWSLVEQKPGPDEIHDVYVVGRDVLTWDEAQALNACPAQTRELLAAWAQAGRVGEAAATLIEHRLRPADVNDAMSRTGLDEDTLLEWLDSVQSDLDDAAICFIVAWRSAGLPGDPPPAAFRFADRDLVDLHGWLDAGFDLYAADRLELAGLDTAIHWREAGFTDIDTYELLRCDPALTPAEARAFDTARPARQRRRDWIYHGFSAGEAVAWTTAGLTPTQARLWRACGKRPAGVAPGQRLPPQLIDGLTHIAVIRSQDGELSYHQWDDLDDPPGTRGRRARRRAGDDDPWINTD